MDAGQGFKNHYEETKFLAEKIVASHTDLPTTIIRPGIVIGHSETGETVKFDGPYFIMRFFDKFQALPIPFIGKGDAFINLVPIDYIVQACVYLAHTEEAKQKTFHLTDPKPYQAKEVYQMICEALLQKTPKWMIPTAVVYGALSIGFFRRWVKVEKETLGYFHCLAEYDNMNARDLLQKARISCPDLKEYIERVVAFYAKHRDDPAKLILVK